MSIIRKNNKSVTPIKRVFKHINGVDTEIKKVQKYNTNASTSVDVWPPSARRIDATLSADTVPKQTIIAETTYPVGEINQQFEPVLTVKVKPHPANAGWYLTTTTGYNLNGHENVIYYGEKNILIPTNTLPELGKFTHNIVVEPKVAGSCEAITCWFLQEESDIIQSNANYIAQWNFNNTLTDSVNGLTLINQTRLNYPEAVPEAVYVDGYNTGDAAIRADYSPVLAGIDDTLPYFDYNVDLSSYIGNDWYQKGLSFSVAAVVRDNATIGFETPGTTAGRLTIAWSWLQPYANLSSSGGNFGTVPVTTAADRISADSAGNYNYSHLAITMEPIVDIYNHPEFTVDADGLGTPVDATAGGINIVWQDPTKSTARRTYAMNTNDVRAYYDTTGNRVNFPRETLNATSWSVLLYRFYINGVMFAGNFAPIPTELLVNGAASTGGYLQPAMPANGNFRFRTSNDPNSAISRIQYFDYISVAEGTMTYNDILTEAANYGVQPGVIKDEVEYKVTSARYRFEPANKTIGGPNVPLSPLLKMFAIDNETLMIGSSPNTFYQERMEDEFPYLAGSDFNHYFSPGYANAIHWELNYYDLFRDYQRQITAFWNDSSNVSLVDATDGTTPIGFTAIRRWNNAVGMRLRKFVDDPALVLNDWKTCKQAEVQEFLIIKLDSPLSQGDSITVNVAGGYSINYTHDHNIPSRAIKVNQVGYQNEPSTPKLAFIGQWLGVHLTLEESQAEEKHPELPDLARSAYYPTQATGWDGTFEIRSVVDQSTVYTGTAQKRNTSDLVASEGWLSWNVAKTGEEIWELDFTDISAADGEYQVYVPSMGYSWKFILGNQAPAKAMYTYTRGLTYQRSGYGGITNPYFPVEFPVAKEESFTSAFPPDWATWGDATEANAGGISYTDLTGDGMGFGVMGANATGKRERNVKGGYHDAADFDRRHVHMRVPRYFCEAFLEDPSKWTEGQFDLQESNDGSGIPDILKEAMWGVDIWFQTQLPEGHAHAGAIRAHIETDKHEAGLTATNDPTWKYYIAQPTARETLNYVQSAALLSRCLYKVDTKEAHRQAEKYAQSAIAAWDYGVNNLYSGSFKDKSDNVYEYNERQDKRDALIYGAATAMYALTRNKKYLPYLSDEYFELWWPNMHQGAGMEGYGVSVKLHLWDLLFEIADIVPKHHAMLSSLILYTADFWAEMIEKDNYYLCWWAQNKGEYTPFFGRPGFNPDWQLPARMEIGSGGNFFGEWNGYGAQHPEKRLMALVHAWAYTRDEKYRNAIIKSMGYWQGANSNGITKTCGLGHSNPSWMLDWHIPGMENQGWWHGRKGVSPYGGMSIGGNFSSGSIALGSAGWGAKADAQSTYGFVAIDMSSLPGYLLEAGTTAASVSGFLARIMPQHRLQSWNLGPYKPQAGEYTVWETMAGKCQIQGVILKNGEAWVPDPSWALEGSTDTKWDVDGHFPSF